LQPETISLPPGHANRIRKSIAILQALGFGVTPLDGDHFMVDMLPAGLAAGACEEVLLEIAQDHEGRVPRAGGEAWLRNHIAEVIAGHAVRARDRLTLEEVEALVVDLVKTDMPYTSPGGRPTLVFTSVAELARKFGRK